MRPLIPPFLAAALLLGLCATPLLAGPPWISVEYPSNPHHPSTRGATFLVRAYHHDVSINVPMSAVAEGLVDGARRSIPLEVTRTSTPGLYAIRADLPGKGAWVVAVTLTQGEETTATALVSLDNSGRVLTASVPNETRDGWVVPRAVTPADIDNELRHAARLAGGDARDAYRTGAAAAGFFALVLVGLKRRRSSEV